MTGRGWRRLIAPAVTVALAAAGCGGSDDEGERGVPPDAKPRAASIEQILRDPRNWNEGLVRVPGRAYPAGDRGFVLRSSDSSIWVAAPSGTAALQPGDRVTVQGEVEVLTQNNADRVEQALRSPTEPGLPPPPDDVVQQTPAEIGEPFIALRRLSAEA